MKVFETSFPDDYRQKEIAEILNYVSKGKFCQLICLPGTGKATILRILAHNDSLIKHHLGEKERSLRLVYINFLELYEFTDLQVFKFLLLSLDQKPQETEDSLILQKQLFESINDIFEARQTLVFLFDHFDEFQAKLTRSFFQMLKTASTTAAKYKFSVVFASRRDLQQLIDDQILKDYWDFFTSNTVYLKVFDDKAVNVLFQQIENVFDKKLLSQQKEAIIKITGGHAKLTKIITELVLQDKGPSLNGLESRNLGGRTLIQNQQVRAALYEIWLFLTSEEQKELYLLSQKKAHEQIGTTQTLIKMDIIDNNHEFTIPILKDFIAKVDTNTFEQKIKYDPQTKEIKRGENDISELLSPQEFRLLKFLIENTNRVIERDEIISAVWPKTQISDAISDEAIDQMVFRLRKKIESEPGNPKHLLTIKGRGLKFEP